jgi:hypothetical protein
LSPSLPRSLLLENLTPASGRQDHTALPSARMPFVVRHARIHRIPSRVSDDHDTPLCWDRTAGNKPVIWGKNKAEYFFLTGWTAKSLICPSSGKSVCNSPVGKLATSAPRLNRVPALCGRTELNLDAAIMTYYLVSGEARRVSDRVDHCRFSPDGFRMRSRVRSRLCVIRVSVD